MLMHWNPSNDNLISLPNRRPETSLTNFVDAPKHGIHPHNAASSQSLNNKGQLRLHSLGITPLILAAMSKMTNSTPSNDSHRTICCLSEKIPFTTLKQGYTSSSLQLIYLTVYSGILQRSLQKVLKVGTVVLGIGRFMFDRHQLKISVQWQVDISIGDYTPLENNLTQYQILDRALSLTFIRWCCKWPYVEAAQVCGLINI